MNAAQRAEALKLARRTAADIVAFDKQCATGRGTDVSVAWEVLYAARDNARRIIQLLEGGQ